MPVIVTPAVRAVALGTAAAALMIGAFALGASRGSASSAGPRLAGAQLTSSASATAKITVTGTGTVTGTPNQLTLAMGVQVNGASVDSALQQASQAVRQVTAGQERPEASEDGRRGRRRARHRLAPCARTAPQAGGAAPEAVPGSRTQQILKATARQAGGRLCRLRRPAPGPMTRRGPIWT